MVETGHPFHDRVSRLVNWAHWFTFFNVLIISLISVRYIIYAGIAETPLGIAYQLISLIGHFSFLAAVVFILALFPLAFFITSQRVYRAVAIIISTLAIVFLILDTQIFKLYSFHLNLLIWTFLQHPEQVEKIYSVYLHYISIPIILFVEFLISFLIWRKKRKLQFIEIGKPIAVVIALFFVTSHLAYIWADATQYRPITQQKSLFPLSYPMTARSFLKRQGWLTDEKLFSNINQQKNVSAGEMDYPKETLTYTNDLNPYSKQNLLIISIGDLNANALNKKDMPHLFKSAQLGLNYRNHFSGGNNRPLGIFSLFYGLPNHYWSEVTLNYIKPVLITRLMELDYNFGLFSTASFLYPEFSQSTFSRLNGKLKGLSTSKNNSLMSDDWIKWKSHQDKNKPWFSFMYYEPKDSTLLEDAESLSIRAKAEKISAYRRQIKNTDLQVNKVIDTLKRNGELNNTIVIITGTNGASTEKNESIKASIANAHVPLIILWPGQDARQITRITSHADIVPTLMESFLGVKERPQSYSNGQSLFDNSSRRYLLSGDRKQYIIYEKDKITQFSTNGKINSITWKGEDIDPDKFDITLLIDAVEKMRAFIK